jgi:hypothetical protein
MQQTKNSYHPLFVILFVLDLLPYEVTQQIPRTTRLTWNKKDLQQTYGHQHCSLYLKHFNDVAYAHKYSFTRYTLATAIAIQKTLLAITQQSTLYKKILRTQKENIIEHITTLALKGFTVAKACKLFALQPSWYYYHKRILNCPLNALKTCFTQQTNQLTYTEQQAIKNWVQLPANQGKCMIQLYYEALDNQIVICGINTFRFYANHFGYQKPLPKPKPKRKKVLKATQLFQYLHADTTYIPTLLDGVLKLTIIRDNYSKAPLHFIINKMNICSKFIKELLEQTFNKYQLFDRTHQINIVTDGGSENKGDVDTWIGQIKAPACVQKIIAKTQLYPHPNNVIERVFHLFKNEFLKGETIIYEKHLHKKVTAFIQHCLNRYFGELYGSTPQRILDGELPDKDKFKPLIKQAQIQRRLANKNFKGCTMPNC